MRCDHHRINVLSFKQLVIMIEPLAITANELFDLFNALGPNIANRGQRDVILAGVCFYLPNVRVEPLGAHTNETEADIIFGRTDARPKRLYWPIDRRTH